MVEESKAAALHKGAYPLMAELEGQHHRLKDIT